MEILRIVLTVIFAIDCIGLTIIVLMQEGKSQALALSPVRQTHTRARTKDVL